MSEQDALLASISSPWNQVYWFARMLINGDKYGSVGKDDRTMVELPAALRLVLCDHSITEAEKVSIARGTIRKLFLDKVKNASARIDRVKQLCYDLEGKLQSTDDIRVFILTCEHVMLPINSAMSQIPSNDREFTEKVSRSYLDTMGDKGLASVINFWDDAGVEGCLNAERAVVVREFGRLRRFLEEQKGIENDLVLTAFMQEFERRLAQKRKSRAGGSLEDVASFLFSYYHIKAATRPEHFQADIEVDKWVRCKDKWLIGISCKRTLRERWKQVSSADTNVLSKFKIKELWHLVTYDEDLSDDKLTLLGGQRHIFYLRDNSRRLAAAQAHIGMQAYVRPMSRFIADIRLEQEA